VLGLALLTSMVPSGAVLAQPGPAKDPKLEEAKRHMDAGVALYNDPSGAKCEEAVKEFSKAYELSGSVKAARARGICEMALELDGAAVDDLQLYVDKPPKDASPSDVTQAQNDLKALKAVVATVTLKSDTPNASVTAVRTPSQGLPITNHYAASITGTTIRIHPGQYTFTATAEGMPDIKWSVEIKNGETSSKLLEFEVAKRNAEDAAKSKNQPKVEDPGTRPMPVSAWVVGGITVACIVPTIAFGVLGLSGKSEFNEKNGKASQADLEDIHDRVVLDSALSDTFLGLTIAGAVTTTILILTRPTVHHAQSPTTEGAEKAWLVVPSLSVDPSTGSPSGSSRANFAAGATFMGSF
jgi:hypothetical protein